MPWSKVQDHADCPSDKPWAVVKDSDGEVEGCHATEAEADDQLAALYASEGDEASTSEINPPMSQVYDSAPLPLEAYSQGFVRGVLAVEELETGDRRRFDAGALTWRDLPLTLDWQPVTDEMHNSSVIVGRIDAINRDGHNIPFTGQLDVAGENGGELQRLIHGGFVRGVSVTLDDMDESDVEMIFPEPEETDEDDDGLEMLFMEPELIVFHHARIMGALVTHQPAMQEAFIELVADADVTGETPAASGTGAAPDEFGAVGSHTTGTSDAAWDAAANEARLTSPMPVSRAREAYAWIDDDAIDGDEITKSGGKFLHHEVSESGAPGVANLTACSAAIGSLNGARGGTTIPESDRQGTYDHLAAHIRDAGNEPPPLATVDEAEELAALTAALITYVDPPLAWFTDPHLREPTPFTVTDDGRVFGHLALWGTCHITFANTCVTPPRETELSYFTTGELVTREGERVAVGRLTFGTNHAPLQLGQRPAIEHYEHTGFVAADVSAGNDKHGIWVAGSVRTHLTEGQLRAIRAASISGDWRRIGNKMRLVGALLVNVPGFPVPRTRTFVHDGAQTALVASGVYHSSPRRVPMKVVDRIAASVGRDRATRLSEVYARVHS
jgi:hypothetical protein